jgi:putative phosphoesterase
MKIAFFSDVHSNLEAFQTVLEDIENRKISKIFFLGDLVGYGPNPNEVIDLMKEKKIPGIMGNYDDAIAYEKESCGCTYNPGRETEIGDESVNWTIKNTTKENKEYLKSLPKRIEFEFEGVKFLLVHGSPLNDLLEYVKPNTPVERLKEIAESVEADIIINGHTHITMIKKVFNKMIFNTGSVGRPKDNDYRTGYLIIDIEKAVLSFEFIRLDYNVKKTCEKISEVNLPAELSTVLALGNTFKMAKPKENLNFKI